MDLRPVPPTNTVSNFAITTLACLLLGCSRSPPVPTLEDRAAEVRAALSETPRTDADIAQDAVRQTPALIAFSHIPRGARVLELGAFGGYFAETLAHWVGPSGHVIAQNPTVFARFAGGLPARHLAERVASGRFSNMTVLEAEFGELGPVDGKLDAAAIMFVWHDAMALDAGGRASLCRHLFEAMRPGARLLFADHAGDRTPQDTALHRVGREVALAELQACGFRLEAQSDLLRNPADDRARSIFDKDLRGRTDRFVLRLVRP